MARGLKLALNLLAIIAVPFLISGLVGLMCVTFLPLQFTQPLEYLYFYLFLAIATLLFITGRSLLLFTDFSHKTHTETLTVNLQYKYFLLLVKEVSFILAVVFVVGSFFNLIAVLTTIDPHWSLFTLCFLLPALLFCYISNKLANRL